MKSVQSWRSQFEVLIRVNKLADGKGWADKVRAKTSHSVESCRNPWNNFYPHLFPMQCSKPIPILHMLTFNESPSSSPSSKISRQRACYYHHRPWRLNWEAHKERRPFQGNILEPDLKLSRVFLETARTAVLKALKRQLLEDKPLDILRTENLFKLLRLRRSR